MQRTLIVLILLIAGLGLYLFNQKSNELSDVQSQQSLEPNQTEIAPTVVEAAKEHIEKLTTESKEQVIDITKADNFVTGEQLLKMPTMESETIAIETVDNRQNAQLTATDQASESTAPAPVQSVVKKIVQEVREQRQTVAETGSTTAQESASAPESQSIVVTQPVDVGSTVVQGTAAAIQSDTIVVTQPIDAIQGSAAAIQSESIVVTQPIDAGSKVIQGSAAAIQSQSVVVTQGAAPAVTFESAQVDTSSVELSTTQPSKSLRPGQRIRLQELLSDPDLAAGTVFYIHAVSPTDAQGLWGILQRGLIKTFAQGIELKESGRVLTAEIPMLADETLENRRSSFLGEFLYQKVQDTYVYNYQQGMLGQDPDLIKPGQQLIIVSYSENELISIFNHFTQPGA